MNTISVSKVNALDSIRFPSQLAYLLISVRHVLCRFIVVSFPHVSSLLPLMPISKNTLSSAKNQLFYSDAPINDDIHVKPANYTKRRKEVGGESGKRGGSGSDLEIRILGFHMLYFQ